MKNVVEIAKELIQQLQNALPGVNSEEEVALFIANLYCEERYPGLYADIVYKPKRLHAKQEARREIKRLLGQINI